MSIPAEIKKELQAVIDILLEKFPSDISKIILFGSYATGKYQPDSDMDLAVVLKTLPAPQKRRQYTQSVETDRELDLLFCTGEQLASNEFVYKHINEQGVVLYEQL